MLVRGKTRRASARSLHFRSEQIPNPASRVSLLDRRDELGVPLTRLDWQVTDRELATVTSWLASLDRDLKTAGTGHVVPPDATWPDRIIGGPHHIGTTRDVVLATVRGRQPRLPRSQCRQPLHGRELSVYNGRACQPDVYPRCIGGEACRPSSTSFGV